MYYLKLFLGCLFFGGPTLYKNIDLLLSHSSHPRDKNYNIEVYVFVSMITILNLACWYFTFDFICWIFTIFKQ